MKKLFDEINPGLEEGEKVRIIFKHLKGSGLEWWQIVKCLVEEYRSFRDKLRENYWG